MDKAEEAGRENARKIAASLCPVCLRVGIRGRRDLLKKAKEIFLKYLGMFLGGLGGIICIAVWIICIALIHAAFRGVGLLISNFLGADVVLCLFVAAITWHYVRKVIRIQRIRNWQLRKKKKMKAEKKAQEEDEYRRMMLCPECGGSGAGAEGQICKKCGGPGIRKTEICTTCEGKGVNMAGHICPNCKGHGKFFI